jgi:indolepyruvate ferredoxin oxidoreductase alpha subunit
VINSCVGCGLCGEVAHAAVLCPSFYRASIIANPTQWDRLKHKVRGAVIGWLQRRLDARQELVASEVFAAANRTSASPDGAGAAA